MAGRIIAIGDIHGCSKALSALLEGIAPTAEDTFVALGDYVDRGPDSRGVVDILLELGTRCQVVPLLGNHEEMMLKVVVNKQPPHDWLQYGGPATLDSYGFSGNVNVIPKNHLDFFQSCRNYAETATHFFVHANYAPKVPLDKQSVRDLRWKSLTEQVPGPHMSGKIAILGHTADKSGEIFQLRHLKCIDTYCYGGGWLTGLDVNSGKVWQANQDGKLRSSAEPA